MRVECYARGAEVGARERVGRRDVCPSCGVDLHSCRQCRFYDTRAYNECGEPQAERVLDKERANFCEWFAPNSVGGTVPASGGGARAELDRLFRRH